MSEAEVDDLVARLRKVQGIGEGWGLPILDGESLDITCGRAADRIAELRLRVKELESWRVAVHDRAEAAEAENARLDSERRAAQNRLAELRSETYVSSLICKLGDDRDEWKRQHENLLAVKAQDNAALTKRAEAAEAERDRLREELALAKETP